jgi:hypothetical protein
MSDIDYNAVAYAGAGVLQLIADEVKRKELDAFLMQIGPLIEAKMREEIESLVDEINSAVSEHYTVRLVHEDTADFIEVQPKKSERPE